MKFLIISFKYTLIYFHKSSIFDTLINTRLKIKFVFWDEILEILFLQENQLENLPTSIKNLKSLKSLLRNNSITKLPSYLKNLT